MACARQGWKNIFADAGSQDEAFFEAFKQRRDYLAMQVEADLKLPTANVFFFPGELLLGSCLFPQAALTDESVSMSEELRQALKQYLVMRQDL